MGWFRSAKAFALGFEQLLLRNSPGEAQKSSVGDHPVGRAQAPAADRPPSLKQLEHLQHPEPTNLPEGLEEALDLAHVRAVREHDAAGPERTADRRDGLPGLGKVKEDPVHIALLDA